MSATELDLPLLPSSEQIRRREFATIRRGYDPDQVRTYLEQIATGVETLERELREARLQPVPEESIVALTEPAEDPYETLAARLADVLRAADVESEKIIEEARAEAARTIGEARTEADRIRVDAQARAEDAREEGHEFLRDARIEAERLLSGLSARRETLVEQLEAMRSKLVSVAHEIESAIDDDVIGIEGAPSIDPTTPATEREEPLDPRYEDLFSSTETIAINVDDLGPDPQSFEGDDGPA